MTYHPQTFIHLALLSYPARSLPIHPPQPPTAVETSKTLTLTEGYHQSNRNVLSLPLLQDCLEGPWNTLLLPLHLASSGICTLTICLVDACGQRHACQLRLSPPHPSPLRLPLQALLYPDCADCQVRSLELHIDDVTAAFTTGPLTLVYEEPIPAPLTSARDLLHSLTPKLPRWGNLQKCLHGNDLLTAKEILADDCRSHWQTLPKKTCQRQQTIPYNAAMLCGKEFLMPERIDWLVVPERMPVPQWTQELNSHAWWPGLGMLYSQTGDERYAQEFVRQLRSWIIGNPLPPYELSFPGTPWSAPLVSYRMGVSWSDALPFFVQSPSLDNSSVILLVTSLLEHARWLKKLPANHLGPPERKAISQLQHLLPFFFLNLP